MENFASALASAKYVTAPGPWIGHIPFAHWLIATLRPRRVVELGTYKGNSYMNFCQAMVDHGVNGQAFAIDTWEGDPQSGYYGEGILSSLRKEHDPSYGFFSTLIQSTFDAARPRFADGSVDLLHIDGCHTYEAVKHDFENWLPVLSDRGVVLFHDTCVCRGDFGVYKFWDEIKGAFPSFNFTHSNGLGVLCVGQQCPEQLLALDSRSGLTPIWSAAFRLFSMLGATYEYPEREATARADVEAYFCQAMAELKGQLQDAQAKLEAQKNVSQGRIDEERAKVLRVLNLGYQRIEDYRTQTRTMQAAQGSAKAAAEGAAGQANALVQEVNHLQHVLAATRQELERARAANHQLVSSTSWKITAPVRHLKFGLRSLKRVLSGRPASPHVSAEYAADQEAQQSLSQAQQTNAVSLQEWMRERAEIISSRRLLSTRRIGILTTQHTMFVAHGYVQVLERLGFSVTLLTSPPEHYEADLYFVICPQMFDRLPPPAKRIVVQMEQSVSSRWFTENYFEILRHSLGIIDYSSVNLEFLEEHGIGYPQTFHIPVGALRNYGDWLSLRGQSVRAGSENWDVLFYGDVNNDRRKFILEKISARFKTKVINDLFGPDLRREIESAKVVVNIHYYENALLETTRLYECISLGKKVVSEVGSDQEFHKDMEAVVGFVPIGDWEAMLQKIDEAVSGTDATDVQSFIKGSARNWQFYIGRMLLGLGVIDYKRFDRRFGIPELKSQSVLLSMPETTIRRNQALTEKDEGTAIFDGLRASPGWIGAAYSYKALAAAAMKSDIRELLVYEDDVDFPPNFPELKATIDAYLASKPGQWDIFSGFIADLHPETKVLDVCERDGVTFVTIDRVVSMVYNIYTRHALHLIARWDDNDRNSATGTIDRYLENTSNLRIVTTLPFSVGHRDDVNSSLWGVHNKEMRSMISISEQLLADRVWEFQVRQLLGNEFKSELDKKDQYRARAF